MDTKRPPQVVVKHAITEAVWEFTQKLGANAPKHEHFPTGWHKVIEKAIDKAYDNYNSSEMGKIEVELERLSNAFK
ncbi:putative proteinase [uncultured Mediterranean phage uvMED]|nr:putative proteinase [uncultured Mediterranean phage uvMED]BAR19745.1 hypothetical protein [uncultured Mediterranean phage uvMED]BAR19820.1 hypothetical protein [uncultured Mediterranean phage uvMED]